MDGPEKQTVDFSFKKIEARDKKIQQLNDEVTQLISYTNIMDSKIDRLQKENRDLKKIIQQYEAGKLESEENLFAKLNSVEKSSLHRGTDSSDKNCSKNNVQAGVVVVEIDRKLKSKLTQVGASKMNVGGKHTRIEGPALEKKKRVTSYKKSSARQNRHQSWFDHAAEKKFKCKKCGMNFSSSEMLSNHSLTHTVECRECGKKFRSLQTLSKHSVIHTNQFECNECGKKFASSLSLSNHSLTHTNSFECEDCGKIFGSSLTLSNHSITHTDQFECEKCGKKLSYSKTLHNHSLKCNGKERFDDWKGFLN